jgi:hypothetical protein
MVPIPGRSVSGGTLVLNCGAINMAPNKGNQPTPLVEEETKF